MHVKSGGGVGQATLLAPPLEKVTGQFSPLPPWFRSLCMSTSPTKCKFSASLWLW